MAEHMLTTTDNPFDPFTQFDEWNAYDMYLGHHSLSLLARIAVTSHELTDADRSQAIDLAIDEIVENNLSGVHRKVTAP